MNNCGGMAACIVVYDCGRRSTLEDAARLVQKATASGQSWLVVALVAGKSDLPEKEVEPEEGRRVAEQFGALFAEVSTVDGGAVQGAFEGMVREVVRLTRAQAESSCR